MEEGFTLDEEGTRPRSPPGAQPCLFRVMSCERLKEPPARHALGHVVTVELGRAPDHTATRADKSLRLGIPDPRASARHAVISRVMGAWMIEDSGSKNGTVVDGKRESRAILRDGSLIEIGRTFFIFRSALFAGEDDAAAHEGTLVPSLAEELSRLAQVAPAGLPILIHGESGTGKEVVARRIHKLSGRKKDLVAVNCGALPANLVESELFGAQKGAFSGADRDRPGLVRAADGGTLFLDEVAELPLQAQVALLRVLQEREVTPVGGTRPVKVDFALVTATHRDLPALIAAQKFRADLFARIAGHRVELLPLRERREDLGLLVASLMERAPRQDLSFSLEAARALFAHDWPLNIRELEQCLLTAAALAQTGHIEREHLKFMPRLTAQPALDPESQERRAELVRLLEEHRGNITRVAGALGKERMQIHRWIKKYAIDLSRYRT